MTNQTGTKRSSEREAIEDRPGRRVRFEEPTLTRGTSKKRAAEDAIETIDPRTDTGEHIEADVRLPRHVLQDIRADTNTGSAEQTSEMRDATDLAPDAD